MYVCSIHSAQVLSAFYAYHLNQTSGMPVAAMPGCRGGGGRCTSCSAGLHCLVWALACMGLASSQSGSNSTLQQCFQQSVGTLQKLFTAARPNSNLSEPIADALSQYSTQCLGVPHNSKPIKILVSREAPALGLWRNRAKQFEASTGIQVMFDSTPSIHYSLELLRELTSNQVHDAFIFDPIALGTAAGLNGLADLEPLINDSPDLDFDGYLRLYRDSSMYMNKTVALQLDGDIFVLYYRADLFQRYNLSLPHTWNAFLDIARAMNGTDTDGDGQPDLFGACFDVADNCKGSFLLPAVAATYIQYEGPPQGFWFDPETAPNLQPLANNVGMEAALKFWQDLTPYTNATKTCNAANADFQAGRCLMTINWGDEFKAIRRSSIAKPGMFAVDRLPGSTHVLDRRTNTFVQCNPQFCPYSREVPASTSGELGFVNRAPFAAFGGYMAGVSSRTSASQQRAAFRFLASLVSPEASWQDVLDPTSTIDPYRESHLRDLDRWVAAGYDRQITEQYHDAIRLSMLNPSVVLDIRLGYDPTTKGYRAPFEPAFKNVTQPGANAETIKQTMQVLQSSVEVMYQRMSKQIPLFLKREPWELAQQYWDMIGRPGSVLDLINSRLPRPPPAPPPPAPIEDRTAPIALILAISIPLVVISLVSVVAAVFYVHHLRTQQHRSLLGKVLAPGVGPNTTLVVTDVQDSTTLFEVLPVSCMDKCMQFICGVIRDGIYKHSGYESATEGDSFIIAFHSASAAVSFCVELQDGLLQVAWPPELFQAEGCDSVHPVWVSSTGDIAQHCKEMLVGNVRPASKGKVRSATQSCLRRIQQKLGFTFGKAQLYDGSTTAEHAGNTVIAQLAIETGEAADETLPGTGSFEDNDDDAPDAWWLSADAAPGQPGDRAAIKTRKRVVRLGSQQLECPADQAAESGVRSKTLGSADAAGKLTLRQLMTWAFTLDQTLGQGTTDSSQKALLVFQGPRIRCAVHSGLTSSQDMQYNKAAGRMHYSGDFLEVAKSVESCAHGGQILMSQETFSLLDRTQLPEQVMLLHMGEFLIGGKKLSAPSVARDSLPEARASRPSHFSSREEKWHEGTQLYTVLSAQAAPRLVLLKYPKVKQTLANGLLDAPVGTVTIGFMQIVGMPDIKAWNAKEASSVLSMYADIVKGQLQQAGGYLVEHVDGFALVAFTDGLSALRWAIDVRQDMLNAPWSQQLLRYGLTEEVSITQVDPDGQQQRVVLLRGPRVKAGFDTGMTKSQVHATTGRMAYRGKVMNRAARIQAVATSAQVLCSAETWAQVLTKSANPNDLGLFNMPIGTVPLKGIKDKVMIYQVNTGLSNSSTTTSTTSPRSKSTSFFITRTPDYQQSTD